MDALAALYTFGILPKKLAAFDPKDYYWRDGGDDGGEDDSDNDDEDEDGW